MKMCGPFFTKITAIFLVFSLAIPVPQVFAQTPVTDDPTPVSQQFSVPEELGRVVAVSGSYIDALPSKPFVVYLQDAHGNFEGQKNIIGLVRWFEEEMGLKGKKTSFFVEGLVGQLDPDMLKVSKDPSENAKNLWSRLEKGEISAASFLSTVEPDKYRFLPLEDKGLYASDLKAFQGALTGNQKALERLKHYRLEAEQSVPRTFSKENLALYQRVQLRKKRSDLIPSHLKALKKSLFSVLEKEVLLSLDEREISFKKYFPSLERVLTLEKKGPEAGTVSSKKLSGLESEDFFNEMNHLEHLLLRLLAKNNEEIRLVDLLEKFDLLEGLLTLEVTRQDWSLYRAKPQEYQSFFWTPELAGFSKTQANPQDAAEIDQGLERSRRFYEGAETRDEVFKRQIANSLVTNESSLVFLVAGGFHAAPLQQFLEENGIPHAVISPRLGELQRGKDLYLASMKGLSLTQSTIPAPLPNDTKSPVAKGASLGSSETPATPGEFPADYIPQLQVRLRVFEGFGTYLTVFKRKVLALKTPPFTPTQMGWIDDALRLGAEAKASLKETHFNQGIITWGKTLLEFHRFIENKDVKAVIARTDLAADENKDWAQVIRTLEGAQREEIAINKIISRHVTQYQLQGMNVKVRGKTTDRGKAVAIGRLVIIDDVNSIEGTQKLNNLHPDDIVVLSDFPTRALSIEAAGIIVSHEVGETAHAVALAREWEIPLFELPLANIFLQDLNERPVKIEINREGDISFGPASPEEERHGKYIVTRERVVVAEKGNFAFDKTGALFNLGDRVKEVVGGEEREVAPSLHHVTLLRNLAQGIAYRASDDGSLWRDEVWDLPPDDPRRKPEAAKGEWFPKLISNQDKYQVDLEGRLYQEGAPIPHPKDPKRAIRRGEWYVGIFNQDAILKRETKRKDIKYPLPFVKGSVILSLDEIGIDLVSSVGVKAAVLGELGLAGIPGAPSKGFVIAFSATEQFLEANDLKGRIAKKAEEIRDYRNEQELESVTSEIKKMILEGKVPEDLKRQIIQNVRDYFGNDPIIFRSSSNLEDLLQEAAPGLYDSIVVRDPTDENILTAVKEVWASAWNTKAAKLRHDRKIPHENVYVAGLALKLIEGSYGGVVYTASTDGDFNRMIVEVTHGGPGNLVDNTKALPARFEVGLPGGEIETIRATSNIGEYTVFENGVPVTRDVPPELRQRPVIRDESKKREIAKTLLDIRGILKREAIDGEVIVDTEGKLHILQARYMVQENEFPVNEWITGIFDVMFLAPLSLLEDKAIGEQGIRELNRARRQGDVAKLIEIARSSRRLQYLALAAIESVWTAARGTLREGPIVDLIAPLFDTDGFLYGLYGSGTAYWMLPPQTAALEKFVFYLKAKGRLPQAMKQKQAEIMREDLTTKMLSHFTSDHLIRDLHEQIYEGKYDEKGALKALTPEESDRLKRLDANLDSQLKRWSIEKLLVRKERERGDDPQRLLWLLNQMWDLRSPNKDVILSEMFLASMNPYARKRVLRLIEDESMLRKESEEFQKKERDVNRNMREIKNEIERVVEALIPIGEQSTFVKIALFEFLEKLEIHYPKYGDPRQTSELSQAGLMYSPLHILQYLKSNVLPQNGTLQDLKNSYLSNAERTEGVMRDLAYSEEVPSLLRLERKLAEAESDRSRYSNATAEIARFIEDRDEARRRARDIFEFIQETRNGLLGLIGNLREVDQVAGKLGFSSAPEFETAYKRFQKAADDVLEVFSKMTDTRVAEVFRSPSKGEMLRDPGPVFKTFRDIGQYLNYVQDSSSKVVELMLASKELTDRSETILTGFRGALDEELQHYLERSPGNLQQLHKLLEMSWEQMTFSPFLKKSIYPLPAEAVLKPRELVFDVPSELEDVRFLFQSFSSFKDDVQITIDVDQGAALPLKLRSGQAARPMYLNIVLMGLVANALEAVTKKSAPGGLIEMRSESYRDEAKGDGILVRIKDNGVGIPARSLERIYDKDFSTKSLFGESEIDPLTNQQKSPFGSGLSILRRQVERELGGWLRHTSQEGQGTEAQLFIPIQGKSLGGASQEIDEVLRERFNIQDPEFRAGFIEDILARIEKAKVALLETTTGEPELVIAEGVATLPTTFGEFEKLLSSHRHLILIDPELGTSALQKVLFEKYGIQKLPERVFLKGFDKKSITSQDLTGLRDALEVQFGDRVGLLVQEKSKELLKTAGRTFFPYQVISSDQAPQDLVLPLVFHLVTGEGKVAAEYQDYVVLQNNVFLILSLDDLVRRILLQSHADRVLAAAA